MPPRAHLLMLASIACSGLVAGAVLLVPSAAKTTSATAATTKAAAHARGNSAVATLSPGAPEFGDIATSSSPTYEQCQAQIQVPCYGPTQLEQAYGTPALYARGIAGRARRRHH